MSLRSLASWLRRNALEDRGYVLAFPALVFAETILSQAIIRNVDFTEIDFQTYLGQSAMFLAGERDYSKLDPEGGSGPCVYPAGHIYLYSLLYRLTDEGKHVLAAQWFFQGLLTATTLVVAALYREAGIPPILTLSLVLSKRIHSIFLLRLFNDPVALLFVYISLLLAVKGRWKASSVLLSFGLSIKMNVLLFLPGLALAGFIQTGFLGALQYLLGVASIQLALSAPFTLYDARAYMANAFDFSRAFLYKWTVNWRFMAEEHFTSRAFATSLLALHLSLLVIFGLFKWSQIGKQGLKWIEQHWHRDEIVVSKMTATGILSLAFVSNLIGVLCSRSLHYQFYSWYFHQIPFLLWFSKLPILLKLAIPLALEWCWNVFPSTTESSLVLLLCHVALLAGSFTLPDLVGPRTTPDPKSAASTQDIKGQNAGDEDEVEVILSPNGSLNVASTENEEQHEPDRFLKGDRGQDRGPDDHGTTTRDRERSAFQRRIATRRRVLAIVGRGMFLLRVVLVALAFGLIVVIPHPDSPMAKGTYVDENALQPGQSRVYWDYFDVAYADMLSEKIARLGLFADSKDRAEFIRLELSSYGLEAQTQSYRYDRNVEGSEGPLTGINVYARSATPRIDGREAIILTASWKSQWTGENDPFADALNTTNARITSSERKTNIRGIASLLSLARYLSTQAHLSKDLIFVVSDGYLEGVNAWSSAFFGDVTADIEAETISNGGSQTWNAISLDYPADSFSSLVVQYEGLDGQLPNMDVVNTFVRIAETVAGGLPTSLNKAGEGRTLLSAARRVSRGIHVDLSHDVERELIKYEDGFRAASRQFMYGASGHPSGPHAFFQRYHVDAISVFAIPATGPYGFYHIGRIVESFVRSMSNLLERLHHSQFIYLLLSPYRFVPIGVVILVPLFLSFSLTFTGLKIWFEEESFSKDKRRKTMEALQTLQKLDLDVEPEVPTLGWCRDRVSGHLTSQYSSPDHLRVSDVTSATLTASMRPIQSGVTCILATILLGAAVLFTLDVLPQDGYRLMPKNFGIFLIGASLICAIVIGEGVLRTGREGQAPARTGRLIRAFAYLQSGMLVAVMSVLNFSLATSLAILLSVALRLGSLQTGPGSRTLAARGGIVWRNCIILILNPVTWLSTASLPLPLAIRTACRRILEEALFSHFILGSKTIAILCLFYLPIILQIQASLWCSSR